MLAFDKLGSIGKLKQSLARLSEFKYFFFKKKFFKALNLLSGFG